MDEPVPASPLISLSAALQAVDAEPEYPGEMPEDMYEAIRKNKNVMEEAFRITVRLTKKAIRLRLEQATTFTWPDCDRNGQKHIFNGPSCVVCGRPDPKH